MVSCLCASECLDACTDGCLRTRTKKKENLANGKRVSLNATDARQLLLGNCNNYAFENITSEPLSLQITGGAS